MPSELPRELIGVVLDPTCLLEIRRACKTFNASAQATFLQRHYSTRKHLYTPKGLQALLQNHHASASCEGVKVDRDLGTG